MNGFKESLSRIAKWAKANPKKTAVIVVAIIIIGYFAIKKGSSENGSSLSSDQNESLDSMGAGLSSVESSGSMSNGNGGGDVSQSLPASGGGSGSDLMSGFDNGGAFGESAPIDSFSGYYGSTESIVNSPSSSMIGATSAARAGSSLVSRPSVSAVASVSPGVKIEKKIATPSKPAPASSLAQKLVASVSKPISAGIVSGKSIAPKAAAVKKPAIIQTPAAKLGWPAAYTGYIQGLYYVAGYPVYGSSNVTQLASAAAKKTGTVAVMHGH